MLDPVTPPVTRCPWCGDDPLYVAYHDTEWGVPLHDDRRLFEMLILEGAQAGLSWITILRKRDGYRAAFGSGTVWNPAADFPLAIFPDLGKVVPCLSVQAQRKT